MKINNLVGSGCCRASAKDTIPLKEGDNLAEILKTEVKLINSEMKVSYNKVLVNKMKYETFIGLLKHIFPKKSNGKIFITRKRRY